MGTVVGTVLNTPGIAGAIPGSVLIGHSHSHRSARIAQNRPRTRRSGPGDT